jgi:hypothetical protein
MKRPSKGLTPLNCAIAAGLVGLLAASYYRSSFAVDQPQIIGFEAKGGKFQISWTGNSWSYDVQSSPDLGSNWHTVYSTSRTNAALAQNGNAGFFRIVDPTTNFTSLVLNLTNLSSAGSLTLKLVPPIDSASDLTFELPDDGSGLGRLMVIPRAALQETDVALDTNGGFIFVTNGVSTGIGGELTALPGPGTNDLTVTGYMTNGNEVVAFSAVSDPRTFEEDLNGVLIGSNFERCLKDPASAAKALQCSSACGSKNSACFFSTFPNFGQKVGVCKFIGTYNAKVGQDVNNPCTFDLQCKLCCKFGYDSGGTNLLDCTTSSLSLQ